MASIQFYIIFQYGFGGIAGVKYAIVRLSFLH